MITEQKENYPPETECSLLVRVTGNDKVGSACEERLHLPAEMALVENRLSPKSIGLPSIFPYFPMIFPYFPMIFPYSNGYHGGIDTDQGRAANSAWGVQRGWQTRWMFVGR